MIRERYRLARLPSRHCFLHPRSVFFRRKQEPHFARPMPPSAVTLEVIGHVRNEVARPRPRGWEKVASRIELLPQHFARIEGLETYSHVIVVFYMDMAADAPEKPDRLTLASGHRYGILATRSQLRPNHLGVTAVPLLGVEEGVLSVRGLDAVNDTPVLDIKPYLPEYDAFPNATIPRG